MNQQRMMIMNKFGSGSSRWMKKMISGSSSNTGAVGAVANSMSSLSSVRRDSRWLSSSSAARTMPTKHSRHLKPMVASWMELSSLEDLLLNQGSLYSYPNSLSQEPSVDKEREEAQRLSDDTRQKIEYTLRGHSSLLPHSLYYDDDDDDSNNNNNNNNKKNDMSAVERMKRMVELLERAEDESRIFCEYRARLKSQLARHRQHHNQQPEEDDDIEDLNKEDEEVELRWRQAKLAKSFGTSPGLSIDMYDLTLDAIAVTAADTSGVDSAVLAKDILQRLLEHDDERMEPTILTYNAVLRTVANTPSVANVKELEQLLTVATETFQSMKCHNAATYKYIIQIYERHLPESKSRANICYALWTEASRNGLIDQPLMDQMISTIQCDPDYLKWSQTNLTSLQDLPHKYRCNAKKFRYQKHKSTY